MKYISFGSYVALITSLLIGAPQGFAQDNEVSNPSALLRLTVAPNASSLVTMKTLSKSNLPTAC